MNINYTTSCVSCTEKDNDGCLVMVPLHLINALVVNGIVAYAEMNAEDGFTK